MRVFIAILFCQIYLAALAMPDSDSIRIEKILSDGFVLSNSNLDSALSLTKHGYSLAEDLEHKFLIATAQYYLGLLHSKMSNFKAADSLLDLSAAYYEQQDSLRLLSMCINEKGSLYLRKFDLDKAEAWFKKSLKIKLDIGDREGEGIVYHNLGIISDYRGDYLEALKYYYQGIPIFEEVGNLEMESNAYNNISVVHFHIKEYDRAIATQQKALDINIRLNNIYNLCMNHVCMSNFYYEIEDFEHSSYHGNRALDLADSLSYIDGQLYALAALGALYAKKKELTESLMYYERFLDVIPDSRNDYMAAEVLLNVGQIYMEIGKDQKAYITLTKSLATMTSLGARKEQMINHEALSLYHIKQKEFKLAYDHLKASKAIGDSLFSEEKTKELLELEKVYENEKQKAELLYKDLLIARRSLQIGIASFFGVLFLVALILYIKRYKREKRNAQRISLQNVELLKRNDILIAELKQLKDHPASLEEMSQKSFTLSDASVIPLGRIGYLRKNGDMIFVFVEGQPGKIIQWGSLKDYASSIFQPPLFIRVNQSVVVNLKHIQAFTRSHVLVKHNEDMFQFNFGRAFKKKALLVLEANFPKVSKIA